MPRLRALSALVLGIAGSLGVNQTDLARRQTDVVLVPPLGLDLYIAAPPHNPTTPEKIAAGHRLFFDQRLSADGRTSCASCHQPEKAFTDGRRVPIGVHRRIGRRNTPSLANRAYGSAFSWDGRATSIEEQVQLAVESPLDLNLPIDQASARVQADPTYIELFAAAFFGPVTAERLTHALATFVRAQLSGNSAYDRFVAGDRATLSPMARSGLELFMGKARCARCHSGPLLSDEDFHNTGVSWGRDDGRFAATGRSEDRGRFKTPSLRNVALTAPYMHDGSIPSLGAVIDFYDRGGNENPNVTDELRPLHLAPAERRALIAFLRSLTSR